MNTHRTKCTDDQDDRAADLAKDREYHIGIWESKKRNLPKLDLKACGVHEKYQPCDFDNFIGNDRIVKGLRGYTGGGLVLRGITGSGKSHLAVALMKHVYGMRWEKYCNDVIGGIGMQESGSVVSTMAGRRPDLSMRFITIPNLLLDIREAYAPNSTKTEKQLIEDFASISFLVLDDLGAEKSSEFAITALYILIDRRDAEMKDTVITTNLSQKEIELKLNARIASRLAGWENVAIDMPDYRKRGK